MEKPKIELKRSSLEERIDKLEKDFLILAHRVSKLEKLIGADKLPSSFLLEKVDTTNPRVVELLFNWAQFLRSKTSNVDPVLDYYISIGWISREVADLLKKYTEGIREEDKDEPFRPEDHIRSLDFINRIKEVSR